MSLESNKTLGGNRSYTHHLMLFNSVFKHNRHNYRFSCHVYFLSFGALFFKRSFDDLSPKSDEKMFYASGLLLLVGAILTIIIMV
jgi:hypothetical protein